MANTYVGIVENRNDPLKLGRCQVRIMGIHTHDKAILPTDDLPWSYPMQPVVSAAMNGIGIAPVGPVEGTTVVIMFMDEPDNQQPIMIGTVGGIPQEKSVLINQEDTQGQLLKDDYGQVAEIQETDRPKPEDETQKTQPEPTFGDIPTTPPPDWRGDRAKAEQGIKACLAACEELGLTTREQKCAVLAIVGGECGWIPQEEGYKYSEERLKAVFKWVTPEDAKLYAKWSGTREEFFSWLYGAPSPKAKQLGNETAEDGGLYYGRGMIQLTGKENYTKIGSAIGIDLLSNPSSLVSDLSTSAKSAAGFIKTKVRGANASDHPGYFMEAAKRTNGVFELEKKQAFYEYFYGTTVPDSGEKAVGAEPPKDKPLTDTVVPNQSSAQGPNGFRDPNGKYPLPKYLFEPDTNRLARGISKGTCVQAKSTRRKLGIPKALDQGEFQEPPVPYGGKYPFNHVFESESGHVQEFDDTPGYERTHWYHRKGTYQEVDPNGTKVTKIVGDSYTIIDRNGSIYIAGEANITTDGKINIFCRSDANVEVSGTANMMVGGDFNIGVTKNMSIAVGGELSVWSRGNMNLQTSAQHHIKSGGSYFQESGGDTNVKADGNFSVDGSIVDLNSGSAGSANTKTLTPPILESGVFAEYPYLVAPIAVNEDIFKYETEEEWQSPAAQQVLKELEAKHGKDERPIQEEAKPVGGNPNQVIADCTIIAATEEFTADFRLSENFTLGMMFDGGFNSKHKLVDQNGLTKQEIVCNLSQVCKNILEPALSILPGGIAGYGKQWRITSGYRQGTSKSQHNKGQAVDIALSQSTPDRSKSTFDLAKAIEAAVPYDQVILEYRSGGQNWVHTSFDSSKRRKMAFTMLNDKTVNQGFALL